MFLKKKNVISQPTGYLNTELFVYIDKFLSLEMFSKGLEAAKIAADSQKAGESRAGVPL